jgi:plastocyanin
MSGRTPLWLGLGLVVAGLVVIVMGVAATGGGNVGPGSPNFVGPGFMIGPGPAPGNLPDPGSPGFVPGTPAAPRVVRIVATAQLRFVPDTVVVKRGETITFEVTSMGPVTHEFMVGPASDVAADKPGTPEITDIGMMGTGSVSYTFDGPGPYAFACHVPEHYEAGMAGTIAIAP